MSKKIKTLLAAIVLLCSAPLFADDFDWSQCWCNYGAGIEKGDVLLSVDGSIPWTFFDAFNSGGWAMPMVIADLEVACPIWKLPFSFGGYAGFGLQNYHYYNNDYLHTIVNTGVSATYHVRMPPENLDLYTGIKTGVCMNFSNYYSSGRYISFDWGYNIGASWYFNDVFGVNLEIGYPMNKAGVVFKF